MKHFVTIFFVFLLIPCCMSPFCKASYDRDRIIISAMELFKNRKYKESILLLKEIRRKYPYSKYDSLCFLKLANAFLILNKNIESANTYSNFNLIYFYDNGLPYSIFNLGVSYFCNSNGIKNDQFCVRNSVKAYIKVLSKFFNSNYAFPAKLKILLCYERLTKYEINLGLFYYKSRNKSSATYRFLKVISFYPDTGSHKIALKYLFKSKVCNYESNNYKKIQF